MLQSFLKPSTNSMFLGENRNYSLIQTSHENLGIYIIAIPEREKYVREFLEGTDLEAEVTVVPAVMMDTLNEKNLVASGKLNHGTGLNMGEVACSLSHRESMRDFLSKPELSHAVFFEDDLKFDPKILKKVKKKSGNKGTTVLDILKSLATSSKNAGWDGLNLGRCFDHCGAEVSASKILGTFDIEKSCNSLCTHAYILTRKGAEILRKFTSPIRTAEDRIRILLNYAGVFRYHSTSPAIFFQRPVPGEHIHVEDNEHYTMECRDHTGACYTKSMQKHCNEVLDEHSCESFLQMLIMKE
mmetsp:Transcript_10363/g.14291  ORF Transcript_10363/g.14291 Transcript_10363/m.14291 type:complete len:299 (-) Transcript_10363:180-1076(-)